MTHGLSFTPTITTLDTRHQLNLNPPDTALYAEE